MNSVSTVTNSFVACCVQNSASASVSVIRVMGSLLYTQSAPQGRRAAMVGTLDKPLISVRSPASPEPSLADHDADARLSHPHLRRAAPRRCRQDGAALRLGSPQAGSRAAPV